MWTSWGDKYEIIPYDKQKRPRKISNVRFIALVVIIVYYVAGRLIFLDLAPEETIYYWIPFAVALLATIAFLILFFLKWKRNDKECDLSLLAGAALLILAAYIISPWCSLFS
ncbi:hypothetical protein [Alistipes putredinis]|uniref:hypothetical protein n=1 Tax=Alistipes putredinis TaxID=28117 RepID=UPI002430D12B|nr:hypothetical protein [Alistipes putredinis]MBS6652107.1 hypothetical protein [Alistipes putredinis]